MHNLRDKQSVDGKAGGPEATPRTNFFVNLGQKNEDYNILDKLGLLIDLVPK